MATRTTTLLHGTHDEASESVHPFDAASGPHADVSVIGNDRDSTSGGAGEATAGTGRGAAGVGATLGTLLGGSAGLMAGIGALPIPGAGPVVAAGWLVAVLIGVGVGAAAGGLLGSLTGAGGDKGDARVHAEAVRRGGTALPARVEEAEAARLEAVLAGGGGHVDAAPRRTEHRAEGWNRPGPAAPDHTASGVQAERERRVRVHGAHAAADVTVRRSAEAVQQGGRSTSDAPPQGAEANADAARRGSETKAEPARWGAQAVVESQRRIAQDAAQRFEGVSRRMAGDTTEEACRMAAPPDAAGGEPRDLQQGVAGLFEGVVRTNLRVAQELFRLSDPAPFVELQQRFARGYTDTLVQNSATLVRAARRTADETLRPLEERIGQRGRANENDPRFQPAAE